MWQVGITGGIGSGKSTITRVFKTLGVPIFNSDEEANKILNSNSLIKQQLIQLFGSNVYINDNLNKTLLSNIIFNNPPLLKKLNAIVHPVVIDTYNQWIKTKNNFNYIIKESALLFETKSNKQLDVIIGVKCNKASRIKRVLKRDPNISVKKIQYIIKNQMPEKEKMSFCKFVLNNNPNKIILPDILKIHQYLMKL